MSECLSSYATCYALKFREIKRNIGGGIAREIKRISTYQEDGPLIEFGFLTAQWIV